MCGLVTQVLKILYEILLKNEPHRIIEEEPYTPPKSLETNGSIRYNLRSKRID